MHYGILQRHSKVINFSNLLILLIFYLVLYQATLHANQVEDNRKNPVKSALKAEIVTKECGIKKNGCIPQYL